MKMLTAALFGAFIPFASSLVAQDATSALPAPTPTHKSAAKSPLVMKGNLDGRDYALTFWANSRFRAQVKDAGRSDDAFLMRTRFGAEFNMNRDVNMVLEFQDSRNFGDEIAGANTGTNDLALLQGYYDSRDILGSGVGLRVGRQKFTFGNQRLVSTLEFSNTSRTWDGIVANYSSGNWSIAALGVQLATGGNNSHDNYWLFGDSISYKGEVDSGNYDLEWLNLYQLQGNGDRLSLWTSSLRSNGTFGAIDYSIEGILQSGENRATDTDISAHAFAATLGYTFDIDDERTMRIGAEYAMASGSDDPTEIGTFASPFPFGHKYHGIADVVGWRNLHDIALHLTLTSGRWKFHAQGHIFQRVEDSDGVYNPGNGLIFAGAGSTDNDIGTEFDIQINYKANKWLSFEGAWGHFMGGDLYEANTGEDSVDFFWVAMSVGF